MINSAPDRTSDGPARAEEAVLSYTLFLKEIDEGR